MRNKGRTKTAIKESEFTDKTPYEMLGIDETASIDEIRRAYLENVKLSPPEKDPQGFKAIRKAYGLLKDKAKRKSLDFSIFRKKSGIDIDLEIVSDPNLLFMDRVFQLMLASSDLYIDDFSSHFLNIDVEVNSLK